MIELNLLNISTFTLYSYCNQVLNNLFHKRTKYQIKFTLSED